MIAKPAPVRREARRSPPVCCIPHSSQRFHVHRLHEQPPSLAHCCLTHLGLQVLWKKLASAQSGSLLLVFVLCIMRLSPSFLVDFSHLLKPYYCSCKPYALPALPLPFFPLVASTRTFQNGRFYLQIHVVPRSTSSAVHVQRPLDVPSNIRCAGRV